MGGATAERLDSQGAGAAEQVQHPGAGHPLSDQVKDRLPDMIQRGPDRRPLGLLQPPACPFPSRDAHPAILYQGVVSRAGADRFQALGHLLQGNPE